MFARLFRCSITFSQNAACNTHPFSPVRGATPRVKLDFSNNTSPIHTFLKCEPRHLPIYLDKNSIDRAQAKGPFLASKSDQG